MNTLYQRIKQIIKKHESLYYLIYHIKIYGLYLMNRFSNYQLEKRRFYRKLGYPLNLKNPQSFNEKIVWKKIYDRNPLLPITADKYRVRSYLKDVLGEEQANQILIPILYVTDKPKTIPFDRLPSSFIIKPNHASGRSLIVKDGHYNPKEIIRTCKRWLQTPYGLEKLEWAYQPIKRKIIVEELLLEEGKIPRDIKFHMFHGKCKIVNITYNRKNNPTISIFNEKWKLLTLRGFRYSQGPKIEKPKNYDKMIEIAEKLSNNFDHIRVDFYNIKGEIYFGELTHYVASGRVKFVPNSFDFELGKCWKIKSKYWIKNKNILIIN